jgi:hypothetical protein
VIKSIPISSTNQLDVQIWRGTAQGDFSVRSAYHMAKEMEIQTQAESFRRIGDSDIWGGGVNLEIIPSKRGKEFLVASMSKHITH